MGIIVFSPSFPPAKLIKTNFLFEIVQSKKLLAIFSDAVTCEGSRLIAEAVDVSFIKFLLFISFTLIDSLVR